MCERLVAFQLFFFVSFCFFNVCFVEFFFKFRFQFRIAEPIAADLQLNSATNSGKPDQRRVGDVVRNTHRNLTGRDLARMFLLRGLAQQNDQVSVGQPVGQLVGQPASRD